MLNGSAKIYPTQGLPQRYHMEKKKHKVDILGPYSRCTGQAEVILTCSVAEERESPNQSIETLSVF